MIGFEVIVSSLSTTEDSSLGGIVVSQCHCRVVGEANL